MAIAKWNASCTKFRLHAHWAAAHHLFRRDRRRLKQVHAISYEALCREPEATMRGVFDFVDLPFQDVLDRELKNSNARYFDAWRESTTLAERRATRLLLDRYVRGWGYELPAG